MGGSDATRAPSTTRLDASGHEARAVPVAVPVILDEDAATATVVTPVETVTLGAAALHAALPLEANATTTIDAHLRTAAVDLSAEERRAPLDVVVALDRSGSMSGAKLALCQETIALLIRELRSDDRFALVSFDHTVKREMDLASMDGDGAKARAEACAHRVKSGGTTNLSGGLLEALQIAADASGAPAVATPVTDDPPPPRRPSAREALSTAITSLFGRDADGAVADGAVKEEAAAVAPPPGAPPKARVRAVMLLTDGHMNAGITDAAQLLNVVRGVLDGDAAGASLYCFGYGSDHNSQLLRQLSTAAGDGRGGYYFVESTESVVGAFADCLGGLMSVVAQNVALEISPAPGSTISRVRRSGAVALDGGRWRVPLGDLFAEEERDVLVDIKLDAALGSAAAVPCIYFRVTYADVVASSLGRAEAVALISRDAAAGRAEAGLNPRVIAQRARLDVADALSAARAAADAGHLAEARETLSKARAALAGAIEGIAGATDAERALVTRLLDDIDECSRGLKTMDAYRSRGAHQMASKAMAHSFQRCMSDSDSDGDDVDAVEGGATLSVPLSMPKSRNVYRNAAKKSMKLKWSSR